MSGTPKVDDMFKVLCESFPVQTYETIDFTV